MLKDPQHYGISEETGMLVINSDISLPDELMPWQTLALDLGRLNKEKRIVEAVKKFPLLDHNKLLTERHYQLAHLFLASITHAYVWQNGIGGAQKILPRQIAVPFCAISDHLGLKPIFCYSDFVLNSARKIDPKGSFNITNLSTHVAPVGGKNFEWFSLVHCITEVAAIPGLKAAFQLFRIVEEDSADIKAAIDALKRLTLSIENMKKAMSKMHERLDPVVFYDEIRIFSNGWGMENTGLEEGLVYEGVNKESVKMQGGSGAQSCSIQVFDALLGVEHLPEQLRYLEGVRKFMPWQHRELIEDALTMPNVKQYIHKRSDEKLIEAFNSCMDAFTNLRSNHINIAAKFVTIQAARERKQLIDAGKQNTRGTGGTTVIQFLKGVRDGTKDSKYVSETS